MNGLIQEITKFREWAGSKGLHPGWSGEWECEYPGWKEIYEEVEDFLKSAEDRPLQPDEMESLLYAFARDNETESILETLEKYPKIALHLSRAARDYPDFDARWQAAVLLGRIGTPEALSLLQNFLTDDAEYVRRRAGFALQEMESKK